VPVAHAYNPILGRQRSKPSQANSSLDPISKVLNTKTRIGRVAQVVEHLPSNSEVLNSNPVLFPDKKKKK
jgi:hypothetical protein